MGRDQYFWRQLPKQREFARLNVTNTVMSKRYLRELVEKNTDAGMTPACPPCAVCAAAAIPLPAFLSLCAPPGAAKADSLVDMRQLEAVLRAELELNAARRQGRSWSRSSW